MLLKKLLWVASPVEYKTYVIRIAARPLGPPLIPRGTMARGRRRAIGAGITRQ